MLRELEIQIDLCADVRSAIEAALVDELRAFLETVKPEDFES